MSEDDDFLLETADKIAAGDEIDWPALARTHPANSRLVDNLRKIAKVAGFFAAIPREPGGSRSGDEHSTKARKHKFTWGHLQVIESIGSGGFGEVFRAFDPILSREVALKLRHKAPGNDSASRLFIDEARRIARVRHRNVLAVHGADVRDGRVGIWVDLLTGNTLEAILADNQPLGEKTVLRITSALASALQAIQDAGLIHGDVKASNVMLEDDGRIVLMDFGAGGELTKAAGTPTFVSPLSAAPELFEGRPASTLGDQYSLGVLLYRMLVGQYPADATTVDDLLRWHECRKQGVTYLAGMPKGPLGDLARNLLNVDPDARPGTSDVLTELARIESLPARRRKNAFVAAIMLSLVLGTIAASVGFFHATRSEMKTAQTASELASVNQFLQDVLVSPRPTDGGRQTTVLDLMDRALERVDTDLADNPAARARTLFIIGESYIHMYLWDKAETALRRSLAIREELLGNTHVDTLLTRAMLAAALAGLQQHEQADVELSAVLPYLADVPAEHAVQSQARITRAHIAYDREELAAAQTLFEELLEFRTDAAWFEEQNYMAARLELAKILEERGNYKEAMEHAGYVFAKSMERNGERHQSSLNARQLIAIIYDRLGQPDKTVELLQRNLEVSEEWLGDKDRYTYIAMMNVAEATYRSGDLRHALILQRRVYDLRDNFYPPGHAITLNVESNYAAMLTDAGQLPEAEDLLAELMPQAIQSLGPDHSVTMIIRLLRTNLLLASGRPEEALTYGNATRSSMVDKLGDAHMLTLQTDKTLGEAHAALGDYDEAERILRQTIVRQSALHGDASLDVMKTVLSLVKALRHNKPREARALQDDLLLKATTALGANHPFAVEVRDLHAQPLK